MHRSLSRSLELSTCLPVTLTRIASRSWLNDLTSFEWYDLDMWISSFAVDREETMSSIHCSRLSLKIQTTEADETRWMNIFKRRSEDSVNMTHELNTRLQWSRAAAAHALECLMNKCWLSIFDLMKKTLREEKTHSKMRKMLLSWFTITCWRNCRRDNTFMNIFRDDFNKAFTKLLLQLHSFINQFICFSYIQCI